MLKKLELSDPQSCMSKAGVEEMTFVLLARDVAAPHAIREWVRERCKLGKNRYDDPQITEALDCADTMDQQRQAMGK